MQFKTTASFALFVNTTAAGDVQRYNCGMSFVFLQNKSKWFYFIRHCREIVRDNYHQTVASNKTIKLGGKLRIIVYSLFLRLTKIAL